MRGGIVVFLVRGVTKRAVIVQGKTFIGARVPRNHVIGVSRVLGSLSRFGISSRVDAFKPHEYLTVWGVKLRKAKGIGHKRISVADGVVVFVVVMAVIALLGWSLAMAASVERECSSRGGVMVKGLVGRYECVSRKDAK